MALFQSLFPVGVSPVQRPPIFSVSTRTTNPFCSSLMEEILHVLPPRRFILLLADIQRVSATYTQSSPTHQSRHDFPPVIVCELKISSNFHVSKRLVRLIIFNCINLIPSRHLFYSISKQWNITFCIVRIFYPLTCNDPSILYIILPFFI